jgi:AcrR family transcriptional regulator
MHANMKEKLIDEGIKLFVRKSYKGTPIESITGKAGVSKGTFYWHFKSKEDLLVHILEQYEHGCIDWVISELSATEGDFHKKYKYFHKISTEFAYRNRDLCVVFTTLAAEFSGSKTSAERKIKAIYQKYRTFLRGLIDQGKREGCVRQDLDSEIAAHLLNAMNSGNLLEWYMNYDDIDGQLLAKTYRNVTLSGILTCEDRERQSVLTL